jgi:hypothetical protein
MKWIDTKVPDTKDINTYRTECGTYLSRIIATNCGTSCTMVVAWILPQDIG